MRRLGAFDSARTSVKRHREHWPPSSGVHYPPPVFPRRMMAQAGLTYRCHLRAFVGCCLLGIALGTLGEFHGVDCGLRFVSMASDVFADIEKPGLWDMWVSIPVSACPFFLPHSLNYQGRRGCLCPEETTWKLSSTVHTDDF